MQGDGASRPIDEAELRQELERLSPFHHDIALPYGLRTDMPELPGGGGQHTRVQTLVHHGFPPLLGEYGGSLDGLAVLDVACNCGGFSFEAARHGASRVLGFDIVPRYLEQAQLIRRALELEQTEFRLLSTTTSRGSRPARSTSRSVSASSTTWRIRSARCAGWPT